MVWAFSKKSALDCFCVFLVSLLCLCLLLQPTHMGHNSGGRKKDYLAAGLTLSLR